MKEVTLNLTPGEVLAIMQVLGDLPTKSGAYPLVVKIKQQSDEQTKEQQNAD